jgi:hypothetical protein
MITSESFSQSDHFDIKPDCRNTIQLIFPSRTIKIPHDLKAGDFCYLEVRNINLNLYKVSFDIKENTDTSSLEIPSFDSIGLDNLTALLGKVTSSSIFSIVKTTKPSFTQSRQKEKDYIIERIKNHLNYLSKAQKELNDIELLIDNLYKKSQYFWLSFITVHSDVSDILAGKFTLNELIEDSNKYHDQLNYLIKSVNDSSYALVKLMINQTTKSQDSVISYLNRYYNELKSSLNKIYSSVDAVQISSLIKSIISLQNNVDKTSKSNSESNYLSIPFRLDIDCPKLSIDIEPRKAGFGLPGYHSGDIILIHPSDYMGIGACFYISGLYDQVYSLEEQNNGTDTILTIVDEKLKHFEIGIASLFHYGLNFGESHFGGHIVMGPALSLANPAKLRLAFGGGLSYGNKQRLSLNFLLMGGYVDRRSKITNITEPEELTVSKLQMSYGLSVGYIYKF